MPVVGAAVGAVMRALQGYGIDGADLARVAGVADSVLNDPGSRLESDTLDDFVAMAAEASGDEAFGLAVARQHAVVGYHLHYLLQASDTLASALERLLQYLRLVGDHLTVTVERAEGVYRLVYTCPEPARGRWLACDAFGGSLVLAARALALAPHLAPVAVELRRPRPAVTAEFDALFRCPIRYGMPRNVVVHSAATMRTPLPTANPRVLQSLEQVVADYVATLTDQTCASRLRRVLVLELRNGPPRRDLVARRLGLSVRTLSRRLAAEQTSYREVLHDVMMTLAREHLADGRKSVTEVAFILGFSDASAFSRAFRRWTRRAPSEFAREGPAPEAPGGVGGPLENAGRGARV